MHYYKWVVGLSDGTNYKEYQGEIDTWQKLQTHITQNNLKITSLHCENNKGERFFIPSSGKKSYHLYNITDVNNKPTSYNMKRILSNTYPHGSKDDYFYTVIEAIYPNYIISLFLDEKTRTNYYIEIKDTT